MFLQGTCECSTLECATRHFILIIAITLLSLGTACYAMHGTGRYSPLISVVTGMCATKLLTNF